MRGLLGEGDARVPVSEPGGAAKGRYRTIEVQAGEHIITAAALRALTVKPSTPTTATTDLRTRMAQLGL
jgi:hypothetical protein